MYFELYADDYEECSLGRIQADFVNQLGVPPPSNDAFREWKENENPALSQDDFLRHVMRYSNERRPHLNPSYSLKIVKRTFIRFSLFYPIKTRQILSHYNGAGESEGFQPDAGEQAFSNYFQASVHGTSRRMLMVRHLCHRHKS